MPTENDPCLLCGAQAWRTLLSLGEHRVTVCDRCGLGRTAPFPDAAGIAAVNTATYSLQKRLAIYRSRSRELSARYRRQLREIARVSGRAPGRILDIGCNTGAFLSVARQLGHEAYGVEMAEEAARYAQRQPGLRVHHGTLEAARYPERSFDVATLWDVIEHVPDPLALLAEARRVLKDDGLLVVQSPNMASAMAAVAGARWGWWTVPDHLYHFTPATMRRLVQAAGLRVVRCDTWEPAHDLMVEILLGIPPLAALSGRPRRGAQRLAYRLSRVLWPLVAPMQRALRRTQRGGLVVVYART